MKRVKDVVEKAYEVESTATYSYLFGLTRLTSYGMKSEELEKAVHTIATDTIIHKHLVKGLLEAINELEKLDKEVEDLAMKQEEVGTSLSPQQKILLSRFIERHFQIEEEMIKVYEEIRDRVEHPLLKSLAERLVENEKRHHQHLKELAEKMMEG